MQHLRALIVDDEVRAVDLLRKLLEETHLFAEIQSSLSADQAARALMTFRPDILFLDIRMPDKDGFTFLKEIKPEQRTFEVIFVTAYDQYALQALKNHAFDYLLKPVDRKELLDTLTQLGEKRREPDVVARLEQFLRDRQDPTKLRISTRTGYIYLDPTSILYCRADGNYTLIDQGDRQHLCSLQLGMIEELLPRHNGFRRLGRSLIINSSLLSQVDRKDNTLTFEKGQASYSLVVTKSQLKELDNTTDA